MKVSVITCTYQRPKFLRRNIKSVLAQTYQDWEQIIVDDGSHPPAFGVVSDFSDERIGYYRKKNSGYFDSLNLALDKVSGEFVAFCDDDDAIFPHKLSLQVSYLAKHKLIGACFSDHLIKRGKRSFLVKLRGKDKKFLSNMLCESFLSNNCCLFRTSLIKKEKFDTKLRSGAEHDWLLRTAIKIKYAYCPGPPVSVYTRHKKNMTEALSSMENVCEIARKHYLLNKNRFARHERSKIESSLLFREGKLFFWKHEYQKARRSFLQSIKIDPRQIESYIFLIFAFPFLGEEYFDKFIPVYEFFSSKIYIKDAS